MPEPACGQGLVVALQANYCWVELDPSGQSGRRRLLCTRRTRLAKSGQIICVGDRVGVNSIDWTAGRGVIAAVDPRSVLLVRPPVANVSLVVVVVALAEPALDPLQLSRFLLTAEATGQAVLLVLSKADLLPEHAVAAWLSRVAAWGYRAVAVSCRSGSGLDRLRERLSQPGLAVVCGPSGVGKSSLLNGLKPELDLRVAAVSGRLQRGRHTTRHVELFALAAGALVADSPGFNRPELPGDPASLGLLFPEVRRDLQLAECRFSNCLHLGEPGCAVGSDWERYGWYAEWVRGLRERSARPEVHAQGQRAAEPGLRWRGDRLEPRLDQQWRQQSRRSQRQQAWREGRDEQEGGEPLSPPGRAD